MKTIERCSKGPSPKTRIGEFREDSCFMRFMRPVRAHNSQKRIYINFRRLVLAGLIVMVLFAAMICSPGQSLRAALGVSPAVDWVFNGKVFERLNRLPISH